MKTKSTLLLSFFLLFLPFHLLYMSGQTPNSEMPRLIYVYDAICGWCYGFSSVIHEIYDDYQGQMEFQVVSGGMVLGEREGIGKEVAPYVSEAYKTVENHTGVKFGEAFLENFNSGQLYFSSLQPAIAMAVFREKLPSRTVEFAHAIQKMVYLDGISPEVPAVYGPVAATFGLDGDAFVQQMADTSYQRQAEADFQFSNQLGVTGFPTVFLFHNDQLYLLARGYSDKASLTGTIDKILAGELETK